MKKLTVIAVVLLAVFALTSICQAKEAGAQKSFMEGLKLFRTKEFKQAIPKFDAAIKANKGFVKAYVFRGLSQFMLEDQNKAIADLNIALQLDPQNVTALFARGEAYLLIGDSKNAITDFSGVLLKQPENSLSYLHRAMCYYRLGDDKKTISDASKAISYNPKSAEAFFMRGVSYWIQELYDASVKDFEKAATLKPNEPYYQLFYYVAKARNGEKSNANLKAFRAKNAGKDEEFPNYLIDMMVGKKEPADCLKIANQFEPERLRPIVLQQTQFFVGQYFFIQGNKAKSDEYIKMALNGPEKLFLIQGLLKAQFYEFLGDKKYSDL
ncbi:MAG: tetratricopeptide repeat protein [Firmicutes bacterium]|nr:tetratricopeptide repeat protein [Bacillota bacterium]